MVMEEPVVEEENVVWTVPGMGLWEASVRARVTVEAWAKDVLRSCGRRRWLAYIGRKGMRRNAREWHR